MMEAVRALGFAARFVTGYIYVPEPRRLRRRRGGGATHAWCQVYLPGAGWVEFDPTNGIVGNRDLIRVAVARDPRQAVPLSGSYRGKRRGFRGMTVQVNVTTEPASPRCRRRERRSLREPSPRRRVWLGTRRRGGCTQKGPTQSCRSVPDTNSVYECPQPTAMLLALNIHPSRRVDLLTEQVLTLHARRSRRATTSTASATSARASSRRPAGPRSPPAFEIYDTGQPDAVAPDARQHDIRDLPDDVLVYLLGSRYCDTDRLGDFAWAQFGGTEPGWPRVQAIFDFVHDHIAFNYQNADPTAHRLRRLSATAPASAATSRTSRSRSAAA